MQAKQTVHTIKIKVNPLFVHKESESGVGNTYFKLCIHKTWHLDRASRKKSLNLKTL